MPPSPQEQPSDSFPRRPWTRSNTMPTSQADARPYTFSYPFQSLLSHLPLLSTAVSSSTSGSAESLVSEAPASRRSSVSSDYTASGRHSSNRSLQSPDPVPQPSPQWTSFHHAYPPPKTRTSSRRHRSRPPLLLQLRRARSGGRLPRPDLEVYPAHGTVRKEKRTRLVICGAHELCKEDLVITRYSSDDGSSDVSPLVIELKIPEGDGIIAILHRCGSSCPVSTVAPQEIVLIHGSAWIAAPLPSGGYSFTSQDGMVMKHAYWLPRTIVAQPRSRARAATNPTLRSSYQTALNSAPESTSKFRLVTTTADAAQAGAADDVTKALMDPSAIQIPAAHRRNISSDSSDNSGTTHLTALAVATGIWVGAREGWLELGPFTAEPSNRRVGVRNSITSAPSASATAPAATDTRDRRASTTGSAAPISAGGERGERKMSSGTKILRFIQRRRASG